MPRLPEKYDLLLDIIVDALVRQALENGDQKNDENETSRTPAGSIDDDSKSKRERKRSCNDC